MHLYPRVSVPVVQIKSHYSGEWRYYCRLLGPYSRLRVNFHGQVQEMQRGGSNFSVEDSLGKKKPLIQLDYRDQVEILFSVCMGK